MTIVTFIYLVFALAFLIAIGYGLWWLLNRVPMAAPLRIIILVVFAFGCFLVALNYLPAFPIGRH